MERPDAAQVARDGGVHDRHAATLDEKRGSIRTEDKCVECKALSKKYGILWAISAIVSIILAFCASALVSIILIPLIVAATLIITFSLKLRCEEDDSLNVSFARQSTNLPESAYFTHTTAAAPRRRHSSHRTVHLATPSPSRRGPQTGRVHYAGPRVTGPPQSQTAATVRGNTKTRRATDQSW